MNELKEPALSEFVWGFLNRLQKANPGYSDGWFEIAEQRRVMPGPVDTEAALSDIDVAIVTHPKSEFASDHKTLVKHYSLRARFLYDAGRYREALDDLEMSYKQGLDYTNHVFGYVNRAPEPTSTSISHYWAAAELDMLERQFPNDYRVQVIQGLYQYSFCIWDEKFFDPAIKRFERAARMNPNSPLPPFLLGRTWRQASIFMKKAASEQRRSELLSKAIGFYNASIKLDQTFWPSYEERADVLSRQKKLDDAVRDYERLIKLSPDRAQAHFDLAMLEFQRKNYRAADWLFGDAIGKRKANEHYLRSTLFERRGDSRTYTGSLRKAIDDYTEAIRYEISAARGSASLKHLRTLYPEFDKLSDQELVQKFQHQFAQDLDVDYLLSEFRKNSSSTFTRLGYLFNKRCNLYVQTRDFKRAVKDHKRITSGFPESEAAANRWRLLGKSDLEERYIDLESVELPYTKAKVWLKTISKKQYSISIIEFDMNAKTVRTGGTTYYRLNGTVLRSEEASYWQPIIPDTVGEDLFRGLTAQ